MWSALVTTTAAAAEQAAMGSEQGGQAQVFLLVDPLVVPHENRKGWGVHIAQPVKEPSNPLLVEDRMYDVRWDNVYPTVRFDPATKKYRMWYV